MGRIEGLAIFAGLLMSVGLVTLRMFGGALDGLNVAAVVFATVAAWWGISLGVLSEGAGDDDALRG